MIASVQMLVNPQQRFMQYGAASQKELQKAMLQDPANPRPYMLKGQSLKYTPEQFGGGCKNAVKELSVAQEKFLSMKPASDIAPNWGKNLTNTMLQECSVSK